MMVAGALQHGRLLGYGAMPFIYVGLFLYYSIKN
jgi:hypothetical protein